MVSYKALNTTSKGTISNVCYTNWNFYADEGVTLIVFTTDYYSIFYR